MIGYGMLGGLTPSLLQPPKKPGFMEGFMADPANQMGLLNAAAALLASSGPSTTKTSLAQSLGQGLGAFTSGRESYRDNDIDRRYKEHLMAKEAGGGGKMIDELTPGHYTPKSLDAFFRDYQSTGEPNYSLLQESINPIRAGGVTYVVGADGVSRPVVAPEVTANNAAAIAGAEQGAKNDANAEAERDKQAIKAEKIEGIVAQAKTLLKDASGSLGGTALSKGKGLIGYSDKTTKSNQQLKLVSGWLTSNVPRMEGPQSNFDAELYKEMAGKVGDSLIPVGDREAALDSLLELQAKYKHLNPDQPAAPQPGGGASRVRKYNPKTGKLE